MKSKICVILAMLLMLFLVPISVHAEETVTVRVDEAGLIGKIFALGDKVEVTGEQNGYYTVKTTDGSFLVEKWLVRVDTEAAPQSWTGYAQDNTGVFANGYLEGEALATLGLNTPLTVEDTMGTIARVTLQDGRAGYVLLSNAMRGPYVYKRGSNSQDGGDIPISNRGNDGLTAVRLGMLIQWEGEQSFTPGTGTILADGTEGYLALFSQGDTVTVTEKGPDICTVKVNDLMGTMLTKLLIFADEEPYTAWDGFAQGNAPQHRHWRLLDEETRLNVNTKLHVIGEVGSVCIVELGDGPAYVPMDKISRNMITYTPSGGGGEWTDPML